MKCVAYPTNSSSAVMICNKIRRISPPAVWNTAKLMQPSTINFQSDNYFKTFLGKTFEANGIKKEKRSKDLKPYNDNIASIKEYRAQMKKRRKMADICNSNSRSSFRTVKKKKRKKEENALWCHQSKRCIQQWC